ncbi:pyridoxamine 5'-phosphate oxidase family protein [Steroidobacter sp. S1-65]|uniref:Pyridoxamine 5'-phosphate oxidase family protein n=1 Tax=Steroidobacter gossypii TaxID=2805490 RepID=A0ABS1X2G1_9GAMM|nr:pyridoxamine 5'-phosphate oxidase family protein [Steroidobacter gossypii]MBM0107424.1 pyridoxamine 5'-phosphate oxidase family protein [Steroidobacter gossypii]
MQAEFEKLGELIKDIRIAMVTTVEPDGTLHTRPLASLAYENDGQLWFYTAIDSAKVSEVMHDVRASVAFSDTSKDAYVAVSGTADIVQDRQRIQELWTPFAKPWFPNGPDDPNLALLRVHVERGEYWTSAGKAAYLFGVAKAAMTGKRTEMGENRKLRM